MYSIAHIIYGTVVPWSEDSFRTVSSAYATQDFIEDNGLTESLDELKAGAEAGEFFEWMDNEPWQTAYHGSAPRRPAWVGVELDSFDDTEHFPVENLNIHPDSGQLMEGERLYMLLPEAVRAVLPPLKTYIVWSSS